VCASDPDSSGFFGKQNRNFLRPPDLLTDCSINPAFASCISPRLTLFTWTQATFAAPLADIVNVQFL